MEIKEFDRQFEELFTKMVETSFEYVDNNKEEVDAVYIFGSTEANNFFFNVFYKINGHFVEMHEVNTVSKRKYDISDKRAFSVLDLGDKYLQEVAGLFKRDNRNIPTLMKMIYNPKTGEFNNDISYELYYTNNAIKTASDVFEEWFEKAKSECT